jgi:hypothetical protein
LRANASISCASFRKRHGKGHYLAQFQKSAQESKNPSTTLSSPLNSTFSSVVSSVFGSGVGSYWESILATFIANSSAALGHPYFYLIRTTTRWSLCQLSGLSPINYSALLLECQLVNIRTKTTDVLRTVRTSAYQGPVTFCPLVPLLPFASHLPAGCRITCCRVPPPRITFCRTAASRVQTMATTRPSGASAVATTPDAPVGFPG